MDSVGPKLGPIMVISHRVPYKQGSPRLVEQASTSKDRLDPALRSWALGQDVNGLNS
jgi:hypothetical protein